MSAQLISSFFIFAVGTGIGILLQRYVLSRGTHVSQLERELDKLKGEQLSMQDALQQHYSQTSELTQNLTNSYQELYEHIARGASQFTEKPLADLKEALEKSEQINKVEAPKDYAEKAALSDQ
ncbi:MAG: DUF1043 family protein [Bermanella sp.]|tara:strand:+ start:1013 stop:1381 length:369 start_codon:yes stop_codon:yes gene_type:complete